MTPKPTSSLNRRSRRRSGILGFTMAEMLVAMGIGMTLIGGATTFLYYAAKASSGITSQATANQQAGDAIELMENQIRLATMVYTDSKNDTLTLGFDTNDAVDSGNGGGGVAWANQDYWAQFKFLGTNTTNFVACRTNELIYIPNTASPNKSNPTQITLVSDGVRNLPNHSIFFVTNSVLAIICFGVVDPNPQDNYEHIEIQAMAASLNRPQQNILTILPPP